MNNMRKIFILMLLSVTATAYPQTKIKIDPKATTPKTSKVTASDNAPVELIKKIIGDAFLGVTQTYQLRDSGGYYGRNGCNVFGETTAMAVKVKGGFLISKKTLQPWAGDSNFDEFSDNYEPVLYETSFFSLDKKTYQKSLRKTAVGNVKDSLAFLIKDKDTFKGEGLRMDKPLTTEKGWLIWLMMDENKKLDLIVEESNVSFIPGNNFERTPPSTLNSILGLGTKNTPLGAALVYALTPEMGKVEFFLAGIAVPDKDKFRLITFDDKSDTTPILNKVSGIQDTPEEADDNKNKTSDKKSSKKKKKDKK